jgi:hypothetical protein
MPFRKIKGHELASCFNCEAELVVRERPLRKNNFTKP